MSAAEIFMLTFQVLGGLALFIFGMNLMSESLRIAAGHGLRVLLGKATANRFYGLLTGTVLGTLIHSSATTVMVVGFINAGLMSLAQAIPPMLGGNLGTSLSMQLVSFRLADYCFVAIGIGFILQMTGRTPRVKHIGKCLLGFGLLFVGIKIMGEAMGTHRDTLKQYLTVIDGHTFVGRLLGVGIALGITAVIQSSGAIIAMSFALSDAGVFTSLWQVYPIIIGAQIGTCATALLGSIGTTLDSRRAAVGNLLNNVLNGCLSMLLAPVWIPLLERTSGIMSRQAANTHTFLMLQSCVVFIPLVAPWVALLTKLLPSKVAPPEPSHLHEEKLDYPEQAICAIMRELRRITHICLQSLQTTLVVIFDESRKNILLIRQNEQVINAIKTAMREYVTALNRRHLSARQAVLAAYLLRCMTELERIGDHIESLCDITLRRHKDPTGRLDKELLEQLRCLYEHVACVLHRLSESFDPDVDDFSGRADRVLASRDAYMLESARIRGLIIERVVNHVYPSVIGVYFLDYLASLDRVVRHAKLIAGIEKRPQYWIKRKKLNKPAEAAHPFKTPERVNPREFLEHVHWDPSASPSSPHTNEIPPNE